MLVNGVNDELKKYLRCENCQKAEELRVLQCHHKMCLQCLWHIEERRNEDGAKACPVCGRLLTKQPTQYPVCKVAQHFSEHKESFVESVAKVKVKKCQSAGCQQGAQHGCSRCKTFLCERCAATPCIRARKKHRLLSLADMTEAGERGLTEWITEKQTYLSDLQTKRAELVGNIRELGQKLIDASTDQMDVVSKETADSLQALSSDLYQVDVAALEGTSTLNFVQSFMSRIERSCLIEILKQVHLFEQKSKVTVTNYQHIHPTDVACLDVALSRKGHLVITRECGIDVLEDGDEVKIIKSVDVTGRAFSIEPYKTDLIIATHPQINRTSTTFITWDEEYVETRRWIANIDASDFTVADNQIIVASQESPNLKRFTLMGIILPDIEWRGESAGIVGLPSATLAFADPKRCKVVRKLIREGQDVVLWSVDVIKPFAMCVDANGCIWVRSNKYDCLTRISPQGIKIQDIMGEQMITEDQEVRNPHKWFGLMVHKGFLYVSHEDGVGRFELSYDSE